MTVLNSIYLCQMHMNSLAFVYWSCTKYIILLYFLPLQSSYILSISKLALKIIWPFPVKEQQDQGYLYGRLLHSLEFLLLLVFLGGLWILPLKGSHLQTIHWTNPSIITIRSVRAEDNGATVQYRIANMELSNVITLFIRKWNCVNEAVHNCYTYNIYGFNIQ